MSAPSQQNCFLALFQAPLNSFSKSFFFFFFLFGEMLSFSPVSFLLLQHRAQALGAVRVAAPSAGASLNCRPRSRLGPASLPEGSDAKREKNIVTTSRTIRVPN